jgi:hypothetical protein
MFDRSSIAAVPELFLTTARFPLQVAVRIRPAGGAMEHWEKALRRCRPSPVRCSRERDFALPLLDQGKTVQRVAINGSPCGPPGRARPDPASHRGLPRPRIRSPGS